MKQEATLIRARLIALAAQQCAPIYVSLDVWDKVEDLSEVLRKMQEEGPHVEESDDEERS